MLRYNDWLLYRNRNIEADIHFIYLHVNLPAIIIAKKVIN